MYTARKLFPRLVDPACLERAAAATVCGKRRRRDVAWFLFRQEEEIERLRAELAAEAWRPAGYELVSVRDPKPRLIARAPIADRVVFTALVQLMEPAFLAGLCPEAYACRPGYGTHRAVLRLWELARRYRYVLHLDVRSYFPSIDLGILRRLLRRRIWDRRFLAVVDRVLDSGTGLYDTPAARAQGRIAPDWPPPGRGLPIGSSTSQLFAAHVFLAELDHFIKRQLRVPGYLRYLDDFFCFGATRGELRSWRGSIRDWLAEERDLRLKHPEAPVLSCRSRLDALGYQISREGIHARPRALHRLRKRLTTEIDRPPGRAPYVDIERSIASSAGIVLF